MYGIPYSVLYQLESRLCNVDFGQDVLYLGVKTHCPVFKREGLMGD